MVEREGVCRQWRGKGCVHGGEGESMGEGEGGCAWAVERECAKGRGRGRAQAREGVHRQWRGKGCMHGDEGEGMGEGGHKGEREGMVERGREYTGSEEGGCVWVVEGEGTGKGGHARAVEREGMCGQQRGKGAWAGMGAGAMS